MRPLMLMSCLPAYAHAAKHLPPGVPVNNTITLNMNSEVFVPLLAATPIPDRNEKGGQLNWPIYVSKDTFGNEGKFDDIVVDNIKVTLRGMYHEYAGDLSIEVVHQQVSAIISSNRGGARKFGRPAQRPYEDVKESKLRRQRFGQDLLAGDGFDYTFSDLIGNNHALGKPGEQSSSMAEDDTAAWRATDGNLVSSGMATHTNVNPWYQVDLEQTRDINTVVLWAPDPENQVNEVQIVKTVGLITLGGSFRLSLEHNGFVEETTDISYDAVAATGFEDSQSTVPGQGKGESMQAKIQALNSVGLVSVTRSDPDRTQGYEWTITFLTEHTNIEALKLSKNDLTAGKLRLPEDQEADVVITTITNGTRSTFYNANMRHGAVLVSDVPFGDTDLAGARALASVEQGFEITYRQRQINIPMPTGTTGRYVRITLKQTSYLSIAEILVFSEHLFSLEVFNGGSPFPETSYAPELAFSDTFGGKEIHGQWVLSITDSAPQEVVHEKKSQRRDIVHGRGALSDWVLEITPRHRVTGQVLNDQVITYYVDMSARILTLPKYGKLYDASEYVKGNLIQAEVGSVIYTGVCAQQIDCNHKYGLGNVLTTSNLGSVAANNKITKNRQVVYVPNPNFKGVDTFTYRIIVGTVPDPRIGTISLNVKHCRINCNNDRLFLEKPTIDEKLMTTWDNRRPTDYPPDKFLQPEKYGEKLWNDPYCDTPPCNSF